VAGLRPDPLGELKHSPDPLAAIWGLLLRGGEGGRKDKGIGGRKEEWKGERKGREGLGKGKEERLQALLWILDTQLTLICPSAGHTLSIAGVHR